MDAVHSVIHQCTFSHEDMNFTSCGGLSQETRFQDYGEERKKSVIHVASLVLEEVVASFAGFLQNKIYFRLVQNQVLDVIFCTGSNEGEIHDDYTNKRCRQKNTVRIDPSTDSNRPTESSCSSYARVKKLASVSKRIKALLTGQVQSPYLVENRAVTKRAERFLPVAIPSCHYMLQSSYLSE